MLIAKLTAVRRLPAPFIVEQLNPLKIPLVSQTLARRFTPHSALFSFGRRALGALSDFRLASFVAAEFRTSQNEFNSRVMTANLEAAEKLCCECVYQSHS
jgi:hypothetical protein